MAGYDFKAKPRRIHQSRGSRTRLLKLEPRLLFDGAALVAADDAVSSTDSQLHPAVAESASSIEHPPALAPEVPAPAREIAFVDRSIPDAQTLAAGVRPGVEVIWLENGNDPWEQMATALAARANVSAIHLLSHGGNGEIVINGQAYGADALASRSQTLATWSAHLTPGADLLIYGCQVATEGSTLLSTLAAATGADVAASTDNTGLGGNWNLEASTGTIEAAPVLTPETAAAYQGWLATVSLSGASGWTAIMFGAAKDPQGDSQAGSSDTDIMGDASHGSFYTAYDDNGTLTTGDDTLAFRLRIDNPSSPGGFSGIAVVGMDANLDGRIDLFVTVDARGSQRIVQLLDPGTGANISPSTTSTSALPTGWLPNNGIYAMTASNYAVATVNVNSDTHWEPTHDDDIGNDGKVDVLVSWKIPIADLATVLGKPSPMDSQGSYGPRGSTGISGYNKDTQVQYISFTATQPGPINGDLNGVGSYDKNATFASLGAFTSPMSASNPVSDGPGVTITTPISGDDILIDSEDASVTFTGAVKGTTGEWVKLTIADSGSGSGATLDVTKWVAVSTTGNSTWTISGVDVSGQLDGTLTVSAELVTTNGGSTAVTGATGDSTTVLHDTVAPAVAFSTPIDTGRPTITGTTTDVPAGSNVTVTIDLDNNGSPDLTYLAIVGSTGIWSVNTAAIAPSGGTLPAAGITSTAKVSATASDAGGNTANATAITRPTANNVISQSTTPTVSGTWNRIVGDSLSVEVNGVSYSLGTPADNTWSVALTNNTGPNALSLDTTYDVKATVSRSAANVTSDPTNTTELQIVSGPVVNILTTATSSITPTIRGTSTGNAVVTLRIDLDGSDTTTGDRVTYSTIANGAGAWSINTASDFPIAGSFPLGGLAGTDNLYAVAYDAQGRAATDADTLTITIPSIAIDAVSSTAGIYYSGTVANGTSATSDGVTATVKTDDLVPVLNAVEDDVVSVSGTYTNATAADTLRVSVTDGTTTKTADYVIPGSSGAISSGTWTVTFSIANSNALSSLRDGTLTASASLSGQSATQNRTIEHDATPPVIVVTSSSSTNSNNPTIAGYASEVSSLSMVYKGGAATNVTVTSSAWSYTGGANSLTNNSTNTYSLTGSDTARNTGTLAGTVTNYQSSVQSITINNVGGTNPDATSPVTVPTFGPTNDSAVTIGGVTTNISVANTPVTITISDSDSSTADVTATATVASPPTRA